MRNYKICHQCGGNMLKVKDSMPFWKNGKCYNIPNVAYFQCEKCGEKVFEATEAKRIDTFLRKNNNT